MKLGRRVVTIVAVVGIALLTQLAWAEKEEKPDAKLHLEAKSVAVGVGFSWGKGKLTYKSKEYPVEVDGLTVGQVGAASITASGDVYNLKKLEDFDGTYTALAGGAAVGGGGGALIMQNQNGVKIELQATSQGVNLTAGGSGVKLKIAK